MFYYIQKVKLENNNPLQIKPLYIESYRHNKSRGKNKTKQKQNVAEI